MKKPFVIGVLLISATALACPQLAGTYKICKNQAGQVTSMTNLTISQDYVSGDVVYSISSTDRETGEVTSELFYANGVTSLASENDPESGAAIKTATTARCIGDALMADINISVASQSFMKASFNFSKIGYAVVNKSTLTDESGQSVTDVTTCE